MPFTFLDCIFIVIIFFIAILASIRGFINELMGKMAFVVAFGAAILFYQRFAQAIKGLIHNNGLSAVLAFVILFVVGFLGVKILQLLLSELFSGKLLGSLNHALGLLFGMVEGLVVVAVILYVLCRQHMFNPYDLLHGSVFVHWLAPFIADPAAAVRGMIA